MNLLTVAIGGALGAAARYALSSLALRASPGFAPAGTLAVNLLGCLAFGVVVSVAQHRVTLSAEARIFLLAGVLGGFTFLAYAYEALLMLRERQALRAWFYVVGQVVLGISAQWPA